MVSSGLVARGRARRGGGSVSTPIETVIEWAMGQREAIGATPATANASAIRLLTGHIAEGEPRTADWFFDNLDELARRWNALSVERKPTTVQTYVSRARTTIEAFRRWQARPTATPMEIWHRRIAKRYDTKPVASTQSVPLGVGRDAFHYLPCRGLTIQDVRRIALHLATLCDDYEPGILETMFKEASR